MSQRLALSLFPDWTPKLPRLAQLSNHVLQKLNTGFRLERVVNAYFDMTTLEQRLSLVQLLTDVVQCGVAGDVVECGCFEGKTAALLTRVAHELDSSRVVHVYDSFGAGFFLGSSADIEERLRANFAAVEARLPQIHKGAFEETIPAQLPAKISFAHIDVGTGADTEIHKSAVLHCLNHVYGRLSPGGVCVLMDCNDGTFFGDEGGFLGVRQLPQGQTRKADRALRRSSDDVILPPRARARDREAGVTIFNLVRWQG